MNRLLIFSFLILNCAFAALGQVSIDNRYPLDSIIPIYRFSKISVGLTLVVGDYNANPEIDSLAGRVEEADELWALYYNKAYDEIKFKLTDSSSYYNLFYNKTISDSLSYLTGKSFYIYGEKGICKAQVSDILIHIDECRSNFILLRLGRIDPSIGNPLFAMTKRVAVKFKKDTVIGEEYKKYLASYHGGYTDTIPSINFPEPGDSTERIPSVNFFEPNNYTDTIPSVNYAKWNNYYLFYSDSFDWYDGSKNCRFPYRRIVQKTNDGFIIIWNQDLDLFGIPCD